MRTDGGGKITREDIEALQARYAKMSENRLREGTAALGKALAANGKKDTAQDQAGQVVNFSK